MAKLTLFAANLVVLFAVAVAFDFSTLIPDLKTLDVFKGKAPSCEKEMQKQQLDFCQRYLQESSRFQPSFTVVHQASSWREAFRQCCEQLEKFSKKCRCDPIRQIVLQQMQGEQLEGIERQEMLQTAQSLPNLCRIKKAQPCNIPTSLASF
ncbi:2S albumin-like [Coffea eugenioides]|uniref:2S albumin-like n=1 Tax=Coffea eugenioides TaxID=49369 RepID=UPI000F615BDF|nr:2S albumin-like [Coffea eugenioides]